MEGILRRDGDCLYVHAVDIDVYYPVVFVKGTTWDASSEAVRLPSGESFRVGEMVHLGGGYFSVEEAAASVGPDAARRLEPCAQAKPNEFGQFAVAG